MKTEISNELILQAHKEACSETKSLIEKEAPELFKRQFPYWKKFVDEDRSIYFFRVIGFNDGYYNFDNDNSRDYWRRTGISPNSLIGENWVDPTPEEIKNHLIALWVK